MRRRQWVQVVAAVAIGGAAALTVPTLPAVADHSPAGFHHDVEVESATLVAKGAALTVTLVVKCGPDAAFAGVNVQVSQARGSHATNGFGGTSTLWCDGLSHSVDVLVQATGGGSFKTGDAVVVADLFACPSIPAPCGQDQDTEVVSVKK